MAVVAALLFSFAGLYAYRDLLWGVRTEARAAIHALEDGDLVALDAHLAANRGRADFAHYFTEGATPRALGDALSTVAGSSEDSPLRAGVDPQAYALTLTDLAGTLALASHGTGGLALPDSWTTDFILATTTPEELYGDGYGRLWKGQREKQDLANRANLLLLLSRGYWSPEFLRAVTKAYHGFDRSEGEDAWPAAEPDEDAQYAPAPGGAYLTDGVLALTAALTANSAASEWAFTKFLPGTVEVDGSDQSIGRFTHFLLFEHQFPEGTDDESLGMTATLTALSSAIHATMPSGDGAVSRSGGGAQVAVSAGRASEIGPLHDSVVLQALAHEAAKGSECSLNPLDYGHCAVALAKAVLSWIQSWGHVVLEILTTASYAPPPFALAGVVIGSSAAAANATWYAIEGDYRAAGLSLAAAVPGLAFGQIAKRASSAKVAINAAKAAQAAKTAKLVVKSARKWRPLKPWNDCDLVVMGGLRLKYQADWTPAQRNAADSKVKAYWEASQRAKLKKVRPQRSGTSAVSRYEKANGVVPNGFDVDHVIDLQLGGADQLSNMHLLESAVNRSLGKQVEARLSKLDYGTTILGAAIC